MNNPRGGAAISDDLQNKMLRQAVCLNLISFPAQVPVFEKQARPDLQQRLVTLYFVRGWTMERIAEHYGLGRQRIGQILTAWRIRAGKEGYIQEIEPEHSLFQRVRQGQADQLVDTSPLKSMAGESPAMPAAPLAATMTRASEADEAPPWRNGARELTGSTVAEELQAIICVLDNQLGLCSKPLLVNINSCEPLLARANMLCARLEARIEDPDNNDEWPLTAVISAAKALFQRFQEYTAQRSRITFKADLASVGPMTHATRSSRVSGMSSRSL